jgi:hypothetical protein
MQAPTLLALIDQDGPDVKLTLDQVCTKGRSSLDQRPRLCRKQHTRDIKGFSCLMLPFTFHLAVKCWLTGV